MQVRLANLSDRQACVDIAQKTLGAGSAVYDYFDSDCCFILVCEGGFCAVMVNVDTADLLDIAVLPEYRGQGRADTLMERMHCECVSRGVKEIFLEVRTDNAPAVSLYKKHGFAEISVRKNYYDDPRCDALVMRRVL